jgi:hypothetical protein
MATSDKGRSDIRPGQHPFSSTGRVIGGDESYGVYGAKGYFKTFQPQFKGRPLRHTEMDFNIDLIGQVIKGYRIVGSSLEADEIDLVNDLDKILMFAERDMEDADGNIIYEEDGITPKVEYVWELSAIGSISGVKGDTGPIGPKGEPGVNGAQGTQGAQGLRGLTGIKGDTGAQGLQGQAGTPAQAVLTYIFLHDTVNPTATPVAAARMAVFPQNGAIVISFLDNTNTDNEFKFRGLFETGNFDITVASQLGSSFYNQYTISDAYVDFTTFAASSCVVIYAQTFNNVQVNNPDPNATGNIAYNGTISNNVFTVSNVFIDKWNSSGSDAVPANTFLNLTVVPNSVDFASATIDDQFIAIHSDIGALSLTGIIASWGILTCTEDITMNIVFTEADNTETTIYTYTHPADDKIFEASINPPISLPALTGIITVTCPSLPTALPLPLGYAVTLRFA